MRYAGLPDNWFSSLRAFVNCVEAEPRCGQHALLIFQQIRQHLFSNHRREVLGRLVPLPALTVNVAVCAGQIVEELAVNVGVEVTLTVAVVAVKLPVPVQVNVPVPLAVKVVLLPEQITVLPVMVTVGLSLMVNLAVAVPIHPPSVVPVTV